MKRVNFKISVIALVIGMFAVSCSGGGSKKQSTAETPETKTEAKADEVYSIPKDKIGILGFQTQAEKDAVLAEFPQELLKAVGEFKFSQIMKCSDTNYKYSFNIKAYSDNGKADLEKLIAYYKSIGATVEKPNEVLAKYNVTLPYAQSVDVYATESAITVMFSVIKQ
jgi:hypothetical protein